MVWQRDIRAKDVFNTGNMYRVWQYWQKTRDPSYSWRNTRMIPGTNVAFCMSTLSNAGHISCHRNFLCPDTLLPGYISLPHLVPCHLQSATFFTIRSTKVSMLRIAMEWPQLLLVNSLGSHLHSSSAVGKRRALAT